METSSCSKCGSTRIIPEAYTAELACGGPLAACVNSNPAAMLFKGTHTGYLKASICGDCGHTELYVENASELYEAYVKSQEPVDA
jgi:predicted nucleic-acid-binding Zn-ribbon protein